uniref:Uncharacterized protein n=1 Tax=Anguilla anguilla TaxID=7936 RepID=A0A0E9QRJ1_ANGAN
MNRSNHHNIIMMKQTVRSKKNGRLKLVSRSGKKINFF